MGNTMRNVFDVIATSVKFVRLQRNTDQETAANEAGVSLRTLQNIEAAKAVNSSSLFAYLAYLGLLDNMLASLPDPNKLTPLERLKSTPQRRERAGKPRKKLHLNQTQDVAAENTPAYQKKNFQWGDES